MPGTEQQPVLALHPTARGAPAGHGGVGPGVLAPGGGAGGQWLCPCWGSLHLPTAPWAEPSLDPGQPLPCCPRSWHWDRWTGDQG